MNIVIGVVCENLKYKIKIYICVWKEVVKKQSLNFLLGIHKIILKILKDLCAWTIAQQVWHLTYMWLTLFQSLASYIHSWVQRQEVTPEHHRIYPKTPLKIKDLY